MFQTCFAKTAVKVFNQTFFITVHEETDTANLRGRSGANNNKSLDPSKTLHFI